MSKTAMFILSILSISLILTTVHAGDKEEDDIDLVIGPEGGMVLKEKSKKGPGSTIVLARKRRSPFFFYDPTGSLAADE